MQIIQHLFHAGTNVPEKCEWKRCAQLEPPRSVSGDSEGTEYSAPGSYDPFQGC